MQGKPSMGESIKKVTQEGKAMGENIRESHPRQIHEGKHSKGENINESHPRRTHMGKPSKGKSI